MQEHDAAPAWQYYGLLHDVLWELGVQSVDDPEPEEEKPLGQAVQADTGWAKIKNVMRSDSMTFDVRQVMG